MDLSRLAGRWRLWRLFACKSFSSTLAMPGAFPSVLDGMVDTSMLSSEMVSILIGVCVLNRHTKCQGTDAYNQELETIAWMGEKREESKPGRSSVPMCKILPVLRIDVVSYEQCRGP